MHCTSASQLPPFRITLVQQTAAIINDRLRGTAKCAGSTLMNASLSDFRKWRFTLLDPPDFPVSRNKIHPTMLVVNSENISAEYIGEFIDRETKYNLLFTFHFFFAEYFSTAEKSEVVRREEEKKDPSTKTRIGVCSGHVENATIRIVRMFSRIKNEWLAETMRNRNFVELKMTSWDFISRYWWYRVTDALALPSGWNARSIRIIIKVAARRIETSAAPESGDGFVHVWSDEVGRPDKIAPSIYRRIPRLTNPDLFDWR